MDDGEKLSPDATPIQICAVAIGRLAEFWDDVADRTGQGHGKFIDEVFGAIWRDGNTGEKFEAEFDQWDDQPEDMKQLGLIQAAFTSCAYACQAMKAQKDDDLLTAWRYTARCEYWLGIVVGAWSLRRLQGEPTSEFAKLGADARHAENRSMKAQVIAWYTENADKLGSKDAAAEQAAGKLVPVKFRTVRDWLKGA